MEDENHGTLQESKNETCFHRFPENNSLVEEGSCSYQQELSNFKIP